MYERRYRVMGLLRGKEVLLFTTINKKYAEKFCETYSTGENGPIEIWIREVFIKGETK